MVWLIVVAVLVVALLAVAVRLRSGSSATAVAPPPMPAESPPPSRGRNYTKGPATPNRVDDPAEMTALESALAEVTDREGRPIGGRIEAEAPHLGDVGTSDDGRPLLRRALDDVERHDVERHDVERHDVERHDVERHDVERHGPQPGAASSEPT